MREMPPLRALRAFESCYRHQSFTRAARELNVGQPAISHQIRLLESDLGLRLFEKRGASVRATEAAERLYATVAPAFVSIAESARELRRQAGADRVRLVTYPGVAAYWAAPRLSVLRAREAGGIAVEIATSERDADISMDMTDCAILFGKGRWPGAEAVMLLPEEVLPIASPGLAAELAGLSPEALIRHAPLIHLEDPERRWFDWDDWQRAFAPAARLPERSLTVTNHGLAIHQALSGGGVALAWRGVVRDLLEGGSAVALHDRPLVSDRGYWLVAQPGFLKSRRGEAILDALTA